MKWLTDKELTEPGRYWKCWRGNDNKYYNLGVIEVGIIYIDALKEPDYNYTSFLYYYGPLETPPPPSGDVWGV